MPVLPGPPPVEITLRRSTRARRFSLRVSRLDGRVTLSVPERAREADAMRFVRDQEEWIRATLAALPRPAAIGPGSTLSVEGRLLTVTAGDGRLVRISGDSLVVPGDAERAGARIGAFLKVLARDRLTEASDRHATAVGRRVARISLRDTRSRWGSCTSNGALMYSWRLIMAPGSVLDYVAAHEVAHLVEMNHSPAFWRVVAGLCPGWKAERAWLRRHGQSLHAIRFGD